MKTPVLVCTVIILLRISAAQASITLPLPLTIIVNDSVYPVSPAFTDSLVILQERSDFFYHIAGAYDTGVYTHTTLRLPQTLKLSDVIKQIVLYYNFISDEPSRKRERLAIFPFFKPKGLPPNIACRYTGDGTFRIVLNDWNIIPVPPAPTPEEKAMYNEIIDLSMDRSTALDEAPDEIIRSVADRYKMDFYEVKYVYQQVLLWQRTP